MFANDNDIPMVNAQIYDGNLVGRKIMVDFNNHGEWFEKISKGSGLNPLQTFRVASVERFGETIFLNFVRNQREEHHRRGKFDGCGEAYRFNVVLK